MTYRNFLENLAARGAFRIRPGLDRIQKVLRGIGNPQDRWPAVHIAGTNGKGSVAAALESVLRASGYRTGLYTSPHLLDLRERVQINGAPLTGGFVALAEEVLRAEQRARTSLTYFELLTAVAFLAFSKLKVDIAIVECGLGGLWDATNVLKQPLASIITSVGLDHTEWLGRDINQIASQKAGIIKRRGYVISGIRGPGRAAVERAAREKNATLVQIGRDFKAEPLATFWRGGVQSIRFRNRGEPAETIAFGLLGSCQVDNAALVMSALKRLDLQGWRLPAAQRDQGLRTLRWPGRLQLIYPRRSAAIILDGAHNPPAVKQLLRSLRNSFFRNVPKTFVFSAFLDKDSKHMGAMISRAASKICLCPLPAPRGAPRAQLHSAFSTMRGPVRFFPSPREALSSALRITPRKGLVVVTGSLALVADILGGLQKTHA